MKSLALLPLLLLLPQDAEVAPAVSWLVRHQLEDGTWGDLACTCPEARPPAVPAKDPELAKRAAPWIAKLSSENLEDREAAGQALLELGPGVLPELKPLADSADAELRARAKSLAQVLQARLSKGRTEDTALALLALQVHGYSHLSRQKVGDRSIGEAVRKGLQFLIAAQDPAGRFGTDRETVLAALVLSEAYALTGSKLFKDPAQKAADAGLAVDSPDASLVAWGSMLFRSSALANLETKDAARDRLLARAGKLDSAPEALLARHLLKRDRDDPVVKALAEKVLARPVVGDSAERDYFAALGLVQASGSHEEGWRKHQEGIKEALLASQRRAKEACAHGSWPGEGLVIRTALRSLTLETYHNCIVVRGAEAPPPGPMGEGGGGK